MQTLFPSIQCDRCLALFRGARDVLTLRDQARAAGWTGEMTQFPEAEGRRAPDLCPSCQPPEVPSP